MSSAFFDAAAAAATRSSSGPGSGVELRGAVIAGRAGGSVVTLDGVVHRRIQRAPGGARALAGQELARLGGEGESPRARVAEPARLLDQRPQARPLRLRPALAAREPAQPLRVP